ncbi:hypothetical protein TUBRATIS_29700 [Tubulinosema ratisbonensis]|uniref:Uncharacterized protein n=1 Tax=Tubulinosema ratisbonensis TaxID=291195 RepID=A0A437AHK4_9MICR|nr:hypothetical protein TUBRATIS_29700 [Tubulinosema ratisbonensis]
MTQQQIKYAFEEGISEDTLSPEFTAKLIYNEYVKNTSANIIGHETLGMNHIRDYSDVFNLDCIFLINHQKYTIKCIISNENSLLSILNGCLTSQNSKKFNSAKRFLTTWDFLSRPIVEKNLIKKMVYSKKIIEKLNKCKSIRPLEDYIEMFKSSTFLINLEAACYIAKKIYYEFE